jgi:hypothetical protein
MIFVAGALLVFGSSWSFGTVFVEIIFAGTISDSSDTVFFYCTSDVVKHTFALKG